MANKELVRQRIKVSHEPTIDPNDYNSSLVRALNWYNVDKDAEPKTWFINHFEKKQIDFPSSNVHPFEYKSAGTLCRMLANGNELSEKHLAFIQSELVRIRALARKTKEVVEEKVTERPSIQDNIDEKAKLFLAEFNALIDDFSITKTAPNVERLVTSMGVSGPVGKRVAARLKAPMAHIEEVLEGKDKQLVEGWSNFKKTDIKKMLGIYEALLAKLNQVKVNAPVRTRKVKVKPAGQIVAKLQYKKEDTDLKIKSIIAANLVGASEVWLYDIKKKKLQCYVASEGTGISVKGTTLINFDIAKSAQKNIRKPETIASLVGVGKRAFGQFYKAINAKEAALNGRVNSECLIIGVFK
jgi:hypothetical protein